jgi:hypothetical protein
VLVGAMGEGSKNSMYTQLSESSWIYKKIQSMNFKEEGYDLVKNWNVKVIICEECTNDEDAINNENVRENFIGTNSINLDVPIISNDEAERDVPMVASFNLKLSIPIRNISEILNAKEQPFAVIEFRFMNIGGSADSYDKEFNAMNEEKAKNLEIKFEEARIIPIGMGIYTWGYALIPNFSLSLNDTWFWCCHKTSNYEKNKLYQLSEVLISYCLATKKINESRTR